jgi:hypothetical protein
MRRIATFGSRFAPARAAALAVAGALALAAAPAAASGRGPLLLVLPASGRGVSAPIVESARSFLVQSLTRLDRFAIVDYDRAPTAEPPQPGQAALLAHTMNADIAVALDVSHQGGETVFVIACYDARTAQLACNVRESTAAGPEIIPQFAEWMVMRMQRALEPQGSLPPTVAVDARPPDNNALPRFLYLGARTGVAIPVISPASSTAVLGGLGVVLGIDSGRLMADLGVDYATGNNQHMTSVSLGLFAPLGETRSVPYLGASAHWVGENLGGQGASGLQLRPTLGLLWGRHEIVKVRAEIAYFVDLFQEHELDRLIVGSGSGHLAQGFVVSVGAGL